MRVALDVTPASAGHTGVARYSRQLAFQLAAIGVELFPFSIGRGTGEVPTDTRRIGVPLRLVEPIWRVTGRPLAERLAGGGDVLHSLDLSIPPTRLPVVATIHDLAAIERPDLHPPAAALMIERRLAALAQASVIISVSNATADALRRHGITHDRIIVTHQAPIPSATPVVLANRPRPFILAVGELTARKDYPTLLRAVAAMSTPLDVVFAGPPGFRSEDVTSLIAPLGLTDRVDVLGRVSDGVLRGLYQSASALCFPSIDEGFGLPLVEAMQHGLPIVASDIDITREVTEGAALLAPVGDSEAFAAQLDAIATQPEVRDRLARQGITRAAEFSWEHTARTTVEAYRLALS